MPSSSPTHDCGFVSQFEKLFGSSREVFESIQDPGCGAKPKLSAWNLLASLAYHVLNDAGHFSAHVFELFRLDIKDSSLSQRRQRMGLEPFAWLMKHALKPLADQSVHNGCFYKGLRLCGIDGSSWSVTNTPQVLKDMSKAVSRRMKAAFAKVQMCALVELGLHNPIAAVVGLKGEGEWRLAEELLECLPEKCLLFVDSALRMRQVSQQIGQFLQGNPERIAGQGAPLEQKSESPQTFRWQRHGQHQRTQGERCRAYGQKEGTDPDPRDSGPDQKARSEQFQSDPAVDHATG